MGKIPRRDITETIPMIIQMTMTNSQIISYNQIKNKISFSASDYNEFIIKNTNCVPIRKLIHDPITKGKEIGSNSYVYESKKFFLRTKVIQEDLYLPNISKESSIPMIPQSFINHNLRKGSVIMSKDSNVGEVAFLEKDYPDHMLCAGLVAIDIKKNQFYTLAFLKDDSFKKQLESMIPKGTILSHAKTKFLDCKIPFPNKQKKETMLFVEEITKGIIRREIAIRNKYNKISEQFEKEILNNTKQQCSSFGFPKYSEIKKTTRFDTGIYEKEYKELVTKIKNYKHGYFTIPLKLLKSGGTPPLRIMGEGTKKWITPVSFYELGCLIEYDHILCKESNITKDCVIIKNRTLKEKLGRHVGTAMFYNFSQFGLSHHSQGCYRVEDYPVSELKFIALTLNTILYRKICGYLSLGSKMREMKISQFTDIPFPKFEPEQKKEFIKFYDSEIDVDNKTEIRIDSFEKYDLTNMDDFGILQLASQSQFLKKLQKFIINKIMNDETIGIKLDKFAFYDLKNS